jgi:2-hydroxychromene-2-carboxylate isomerase
MKARFYFDIISPFAYFYVKLRHRLEPRLHIEPVPVLLGGLLRAARNQGPGEIPIKRSYTYQFCVWQAAKLGIPFRFPEHHPFITVAAQRLLVQEQADWPMVERAFEYVWVIGKDPNLHWSDFCTYLHLDPTTPRPDSAQTKAGLIANTQEAVDRGAFGVPTLAIGDQIFWGVDAIDWAIDYLNHPAMFDQEAFQAATSVPNGLPPTPA